MFTKIPIQLGQMLRLLRKFQSSVFAIFRENDVNFLKFDRIDISCFWCRWRLLVTILSLLDSPSLLMECRSILCSTCTGHWTLLRSELWRVLLEQCTLDCGITHNKRENHCLLYVLLWNGWGIIQTQLHKRRIRSSWKKIWSQLKRNWRKKKKERKHVSWGRCSVIDGILAVPSWVLEQAEKQKQARKLKEEQEVAEKSVKQVWETCRLSLVTKN